jgi:hypothetical protein
MLEYLYDGSLNVETGSSYNYCNVRKGRLVLYNSENDYYEFLHAVGDVHVLGVSIDDVLYYPETTSYYHVRLLARDGREYLKQDYSFLLVELPFRPLCVSYACYTKKY